MKSTLAPRKATNSAPRLHRELAGLIEVRRPARVLFTIGIGSLQAIARCEAHAPDMRDALRRYLHEGPGARRPFSQGFDVLECGFGFGGDSESSWCFIDLRRCAWLDRTRTPSENHRAFMSRDWARLK